MNSFFYYTYLAIKIAYTDINYSILQENIPSTYLQLTIMTIKFLLNFKIQ